MIFRTTASMSPTSAPRVNTSSWQAKGLAAWYPMVFPGGTSLFDLSGHNNHGLFDATHPPVWDWDGDGHSIVRCGDVNTDKIALPQVLGAYSDASLWMWIRNNNNTSGGAFANISADLSAAASTYPFTDGLIYADWMFDSRINSISDNGFNKDVWHAICSRTAPIASTGKQFWQAGVMLAQATGSSSQTVNTSEWYIGNSTPALRWPGWIGEVRIYNYALSDSEIMELAKPNARFDLWSPQVSRTWFLPGSSPVGTISGLFFPMSGH